MTKHDQTIALNVGNISFDSILGGYYQDFSPAINHFSNGYAYIDKNGLPYQLINNQPVYSIILTIQYGLICNEWYLKNHEPEKNKASILKCIKWLDENKVEFYDSYVWLSPINEQYGINEGWISGMYQGQAISLYLRAFQLFNNHEYLKTSEKIFNSFKYDFKDGGFIRIDKHDCVWFEEYPTNPPSYVLNGFIYGMFGVLDLYRITKRKEIKDLWEECIRTLEVNLPKYDVWYWSIYDQLKQELASFYYQKNVHIPLMKILFNLTGKDIFNQYATKWEKNLKNPFHQIITQVMYRIKPRLIKLKRKF